MRRLWLLAGLLVITGCDSVRNLFSAHADAAAEAEGQALPADQLAAILGSTKGLVLSTEAADLVANAWVDYTLLSQALVKGVRMDDSATIAELMWPQIAIIKGDRLFDTLLSRKLQLSPAAADSVYGAGELRVIQHILYGVPSTAEAPVRDEARRKAGATLARLRAGADFGALAGVESQDFGSARDSGYLPPSPRGKFVTAFDSAAWALPPGGLSGIVETPFGYHILRRPPAEAVRGRLLAFLEETTATTLDSIYRDSLAQARDLKVASGTPAAMREALADPEHDRKSGRKLVTWRGGAFTVSDFLRWMYAMPPQLPTQLRGAPDDQLELFAQILAQNAILLDQADSMDIGLTDLEWQAVRQQYRSEVDSLRILLGFGASLTDSSVSEDERARLAALRVDTYFNEVAAGKTRLRRIPATLSSWLRERSRFRVHQAGLIRAVELAQAVKATADSAALADSLRGAPAPGRADTSGGRPPAGP